MNEAPWISERVISEEPPMTVVAVKDSHGDIADRTPEECDHCGPGFSIWRWRHNGGRECWLEIDGIGPWEGVDDHSAHD